MRILAQEQSDLGYVNDVMDTFHTHREGKLMDGTIELPKLNRSPVVILFMSIGNPEIRAKVEHVLADNLQKAMDRLRDKAQQLVRKNHVDPKWIKFDFVTHIQELSFTELVKQIAKTRRNYFRSGIAFDQDFRLAFLEQEINGNAMIRNVNKSPLQLDEKNINNYLENNTNLLIPFIKRRYVNKEEYTFNKKSLFIYRYDVTDLELYIECVNIYISKYI